MPIFLDRHDRAFISPSELATAHARDLAVQAKYGVSYRTYWFDPDKGTVFCLIDAPSREAADAVHQEAHADSASVMIELPENMPLELLIGALPVHADDRATITPATRAIVFTDMCGSVAQTHEFGDEGHMARLREHDRIVRYELAVNDGREVKHTGDGIMASFTSVAAAVSFAISVQRGVEEQNGDSAAPFRVSIGISAGEPVTNESNDLFGAAVQLAARLCAAADEGDILTSVAVRELCIGKPFEFSDHGLLDLKGWPDPIQSYAVTTR